MADPQLLLSPDDELNPMLTFGGSLDTPMMLENHRQLLDYIGDKAPHQSRMAMFKALLPKVALTSQLEGHVVSPTDDFSTSIISSLLIYAVSNSFAGLSRPPIEMVLNYFKHQRDSRFFQYVQHAVGPEAEAFAEKLLPAAIESKDASIVELLLKKRLNPNEMFCDVKWGRCTPIEFSSRLHSIEITSLLLGAGADVKKTFAAGNQTCGALEHALHGVDRQSVPSYELLRMILDANSKIRYEVFKFALEQAHDNSVLAVLICFGPEANHIQWVEKGILEKVAEWFDDGTATRTVKSVLPACVDATDGYPPRMLQKFQSALDAAAEKGSLGLVQLLLSHIGMTEQTFARAIKSTNKDLIRFLLDAGADVDIPASTRVSMHRITTPFAEAIRWGDEEILRLMECQGAWSKIREESRFRAALKAASEVGHVPIVQRLLGIRENIHLSLLSEALEPAVENNHEVIALALLNAGAGVGIQNLEKRFPRLLKAATGKGQVAVVQGLLDTTENIDPAYLHGALLKAIEEDQATIAVMLLNAGADVEVATAKEVDYEDEESALSVAIRKRNARLVQLILDTDVNFDVHINDSGHGRGCRSERPVLVEACEWGNHSIIQMLIANGADVNAVSDEGYTPLTVSAKRKDFELLQLLLDAGADVNHTISICLARNLSLGWEATNSVSRTGRIKTPLMVATINGDLEMIDWILSIGGDPNDSKALLESLSQATTVTEKLLTAFSRTYPHGKRGYGWETLVAVIQEKRFWLIDLLLKAGVNANSTALLAAIVVQQDQNLDILRKLLQAIKKPNSIVQIFHGGKQTVLLAAIGTHNIQKVQLVIDAGAEVNWPATKGVKRTPLQRAAEIGDLQVIQLLLQQGASVNAPPAAKGGGTALQFAAIGGYVGIAELLLENDADVDAPAARVNGRTALEGAAEHGRIDMVKLLLNVGAKIQGLGQRQFERALHLAKENGHLACRRYLETLSTLSAQNCAEASERGRRDLERSRPRPTRERG